MTRSRRRTGAALAVLCVLVLALSGCDGVRERARVVWPDMEGPRRERPPLAGKVEPLEEGKYLGVYVPPAPFPPRGIDEFERMAGKHVAIVMWYQPWARSNKSRFDSARVVEVMRRGKVPMITWEPWDPGGNANLVQNPDTQAQFRLSAINSGAFDSYMRSWAREIRDLGGPIMLRPMHEMNGNWYPWCGRANGNRPEEFVAAWRRMHEIFDEEGATNVTWVWSINHESVPQSADNSYAAYYPGDQYVDWTAISGFNWGTTSPYSTWRPYEHWYGKPLAFLATLGKPICIAEFATVEQGGDKAAWLTDAYARIAADPRVQAVVYFDSLEEGQRSVQDWRVDTSPESVQAFRTAIAPGTFVGAAPPVLRDWARSLSVGQQRFLTAFEPLY